MEVNCINCSNCIETHEYKNRMFEYTYYCAAGGFVIQGGMIRECNDFTQKES